jgi:hypothetical protein
LGEGHAGEGGGGGAQLDMSTDCVGTEALSGNPCRGVDTGCSSARVTQATGGLERVPARPNRAAPERLGFASLTRKDAHSSSPDSERGKRAGPVRSLRSGLDPACDGFEPPAGVG